MIKNLLQRFYFFFLVPFFVVFTGLLFWKPLSSLIHIEREKFESSLEVPLDRNEEKPSYPFHLSLKEKTLASYHKEPFGEMLHVLRELFVDSKQPVEVAFKGSFLGINIEGNILVPIHHFTDSYEISFRVDSHPFTSQKQGKTLFPGFILYEGKFNNGTYREKEHQLLFTDINGTFYFENNTIHFPQIETYCEGIYLAGSIDIEPSAVESSVYGWNIVAHTLNGKVSQLQHLLTRFHKPLFFLKFPLEADMALRGKGANLSFFVGKENSLQAHIEGSLFNGSISCDNANLSLQGVSMNFAYDLANDNLDFTDVQGAFLIGKPNHAEEYLLAAEQIRFSNYSQNKGEFDIWIGDNNRDVIRLKGKTRIPLAYPTADYIEFTLDHNLTHFADVHPASFYLVMKDWSQIEEFKLQLNLQLETLLHDLQRFSRTGLLFLSRHFLKELNELHDAQGHFLVDIQYDNQRSYLQYNVKGHDIGIGKYTVNTYSLKGKNNGNTWSIDEMQIDDLSFAADILRKPESWKINFLGLRQAGLFLMGLEGEYFETEKVLKAQINLLETTLEKLQEVIKVKTILKPSELSGDIKARGSFQIEFGKGSSGLKIESSLNASLSSWKFKEIALEDVENVLCSYVSDKGFVIHQADFFLKSSQTGEKWGRLMLEKAEMDFIHDEFQMLGLYRYLDQDFWILARSISPTQNTSEIFISQEHPHQPPKHEKKSLTLQWENEKDQGFTIQKIKGELMGLSLDLLKDPVSSLDSNHYEFEGIIKANIPEVVPLLPIKIRKILADWQIGSEYSLKGKYFIPKNSTSALCFKGLLEGHHCTFKGYLIDSLTAEVECHPDLITLKEVSAIDPAGSFFINKALLSKDKNSNWSVNIPNLFVNQFRPSQLRLMDGLQKSQIKPFVIKQLTLQDLSGKINDPSSLTGKGKLTFSNVNKNHAENPMFEIPSEMISEIGLDFAVLNPVAGTVYYEMNKKKIYLTKFKDVYSEGKLSRFYLPNAPYSSYVDFDGNLHMQIRIKQYNLFFKLAELFTISIQGTCQHPTYTLHTQHDTT